VYQKDELHQVLVLRNFYWKVCLTKSGFGQHFPQYYARLCPFSMVPFLFDIIRSCCIYLHNKSWGIVLHN